jgi:hypothetical protein
VHAAETVDELAVLCDSCGGRRAGMHPRLQAPGFFLPLPDRHVSLDLLHQPLGGGECLAAVRGGDCWLK